jgi:hypothetical protein
METLRNPNDTERVLEYLTFLAGQGDWQDVPDEHFITVLSWFVAQGMVTGIDLTSPVGKAVLESVNGVWEEYDRWARAAEGS